MDWLSFIAALVTALAWPVTLLICVILLRKWLIAVAPALRRIKYKDFDFEFGEKLEQLEGEADQAKLPPPEEDSRLQAGDPDSWTFEEYIERLAPISPRVAVSEAWRRVEQAMKTAVDRSEEGMPPRSFRDQVRFLSGSGVIDERGVNFIHELKSLRNKAVHAGEFDLSYEQALDYAELAERVIWALESGGLIKPVL